MTLSSHRIESSQDLPRAVERLGRNFSLPDPTVQILVIASMSGTKRRRIRDQLRSAGYSTRRLKWSDRRDGSGAPPNSLSPVQQFLRGVVAAVYMVVYGLLGLIPRTLTLLVGRGYRVYVVKAPPSAGGVAPAGPSGGNDPGPFGSGDREPRNPLSPQPAIGMDPRLP